MDHGFTPREAREAVRYHCSRLEYLAVCSTVGEPRVDLDGQQVGAVTPKQADYAIARIGQILASIKYMRRWPEYDVT